MSDEQDRAAARQWIVDRAAEIRKNWRRRFGLPIDVESAYLAGLSAARAQTEELVEALTFYADHNSWTHPNQANAGEMWDTPVEFDNYGDKARAALAKVTK